MERPKSTRHAVLLAALLAAAACVHAAPTPSERGLARAELHELQRLLAGRGHCDVKADGVHGPRTAAAVRAEEARLGWGPTGRPGSRLLQALRDDRAGAVGCTAGVPPAAGAVFTTSQPAPGASLPPVAPPAPPPTQTAPPIAPRPPTAPASGGATRPPHETAPASAPAAGAQPPAVLPPPALPAGRASAPS